MDFLHLRHTWYSVLTIPRRLNPNNINLLGFLKKCIKAAIALLIKIPHVTVGYFVYFMVPMSGLEPPTSGLWVPCSNQLSYIGLSNDMVAEVWIEHTTSRLWALRATTALLRDKIEIYSTIWFFDAPWLYGIMESVNIFFDCKYQILYMKYRKTGSRQGWKYVLICYDSFSLSI